MLYLVEGPSKEKPTDFESEIKKHGLEEKYQNILQDTENKEFWDYIQDLPEIDMKSKDVKEISLLELVENSQRQQDRVIKKFSEQELEEAFSLENTGIRREKQSLRFKKNRKEN
ncbi:hypothetical protein M0811_12748 [Anaeramoeba ignava]|uniref:Uncharacterized protein n=1 Tax=Anaeramoeba ignava TaxID=1746090 RepID=A0A9Q0L7R7_ANAIG|nr:hypothetical protein M0811_12748 [Anaeramoeba ignava]